MILPFKSQFKNWRSDTPTYFVELICKGLIEHGLTTKEELIKRFSNNHLSNEPWFSKEFAHMMDDKTFDIVLNGLHKSKVHTIRPNKRWKEGMDIHMRVYNRTKKTFMFAPKLKVISTQDIEIKWQDHGVTGKSVAVYVDDRNISAASFKSHQMFDCYDEDTEAITALVENDGFKNREDFFEWFKEDFEGQIIHWTDCKY